MVVVVFHVVDKIQIMADEEPWELRCEESENNESSKQGMKNIPDTSPLLKFRNYTGLSKLKTFERESQAFARSSKNSPSPI